MRKLAIMLVLSAIAGIPFIINAEEDEKNYDRRERYDERGDQSRKKDERKNSESDTKKMAEDLKKIMRMKMQLEKMIEAFKRKYGWYPKFMAEENRQGRGERPQMHQSDKSRKRNSGSDRRRKHDSDQEDMPPPPPED